MKKEPFNQQKYIDKYKREHYDRITILVPKGEKERYKRIAEQKGVSVSQWIVGACKREFDRQKGIE